MLLGMTKQSILSISLNNYLFLTHSNQINSLHLKLDYQLIHYLFLQLIYLYYELIIITSNLKLLNLDDLVIVWLINEIIIYYN